MVEGASRSRADLNRPEAVVRGEGQLVNIHAGAGASYGVTGTLREGQQVTPSGRYDKGWAELAEGGWVHRDHLESITGSGFVNR